MKIFKKERKKKIILIIIGCITSISLFAEFPQEKVTELIFNNHQKKSISNNGKERSSFKTQLFGNYPNPFNPETTISFSLNTKNTEDTKIIIYNIKGQKNRTLECINRVNAKTTRSFYSITWDGTDNSGKAVSSGIYFYQLKAGNEFSQTKRLLLLK